MKWIKILGFILVVMLGIFLFIYGEKDDSPGCQSLGLLLVIVSVSLMIKKKINFIN